MVARMSGSRDGVRGGVDDMMDKDEGGLPAGSGAVLGRGKTTGHGVTLKLEAERALGNFWLMFRGRRLI
jgi:hypothetical protein